MRSRRSSSRARWHATTSGRERGSTDTGVCGWSLAGAALVRIVDVGTVTSRQPHTARREEGPRRPLPRASAGDDDVLEQVASPLCRPEETHREQQQRCLASTVRTDQSGDTPTRTVTLQCRSTHGPQLYRFPRSDASTAAGSGWSSSPPDLRPVGSVRRSDRNRARCLRDGDLQHQHVAACQRVARGNRCRRSRDPRTLAGHSEWFPFNGRASHHGHPRSAIRLDLCNRPRHAED